MAELNSKVVNWLKQGHLRESLLGEDEFFLADYGDPSRHDVMLVMYVVINWAFQADRARDVGLTFQDTLLELSAARPDELMDILLAYTITARDLGKQLPCDLGRVFETLRTRLPSNGPESETGPAVAARLADLRKRLVQLGVELKP